jgi:HD-like signal output (HDOD) protein
MWHLLSFRYARAIIVREAPLTARPGPDFFDRLKAGYMLPPLSAVAMRLVELASDERCSVKDLVSLIEKDPSMTVRLLRLANSTFYRTGQPATSINQAIVRIGYHQLRIMALSLSLRDTFPMGRKNSFDYEKFWRRSLYQALIARSLTERIKTCNPDEAFVAGLTLGIGFPIFFDLVIRPAGMEIPVDITTLKELLSWEIVSFGINHREAGIAALTHWKFPATIVDCQKAPSCGGPAENLPWVCESARVLAGLLLRRSTDFHAVFREGKEMLRIDSDAMSAILVTTFLDVEQIAEDMRIEMTAERDLLSLMEKANKALSEISEKIARWPHDQEGPDSLPSFAGLGTREKRGKEVTRTLEAVAHEIRNPLVSVAGFARRLASALDPTSKGGRYAEIILQEAQRLESALAQMTE